jgi:hypothetical protein
MRTCKPPMSTLVAALGTLRGESRMSFRDSLREGFANARQLAAQGDPDVFAPLLQQLEDAGTEREAMVAMLQISIAAADELQSEYLVARGV